MTKNINALSHSQLLSAVLELADPTMSGTVPPELQLLQSVCRSVFPQDEEFVIIDPEMGDDEVPEWVFALPEQQIAEWLGDQEYSLGYGDLRLLSTSRGAGVVVSFGGTPVNSAFSMYVLPVALLGYMAGPND